MNETFRWTLLAAAPWGVEWMMGHPVLFVFGFAMVAGWGFFALIAAGGSLGEKEPEWSDVRPRGNEKAGRDLASPAPCGGGAGAMSEERREAVLSLLLCDWEAMPMVRVFGDPAVAECVALTRQQQEAWLRWAHGQVRDFDGGRWMCSVKRGGEIWWLRFVEVGVHQWPVIPAEEGSRA